MAGRLRKMALTRAGEGGDRERARIGGDLRCAGRADRSVFAARHQLAVSCVSFREPMLEEFAKR